MFALKSFRHLKLLGSTNIKPNQRGITVLFQANNVIPSPAHQNNFYRLNSTTSEATTKNQIYFGTLTPKIRAVKAFSLSTSLVGLAAQPLLVEKASELGGTSIAIIACSFVGFFTFVTPLVLHFITKKYVTEINYDPIKEEYTATTLSILLRKKETKFQVEDIEVPDVAGMFTTFFAKKTALFVDVELFNDPSHYIKMMGYDKPMDFKLKLNETESKEHSKQDK